MKKIRALLAIILALSLLFATQVTAFALEEEPCCDDVHDIGEVVTEGAEVSPQNIICDVAGHSKGDFIEQRWNPEPNIATYCYYEVLYQDYYCSRCGISFTVKTNQVHSRTHNKVYDYSSENQYKGWHCTLCNYYSWK